MSQLAKLWLSPLATGRLLFPLATLWLSPLATLCLSPLVTGIVVVAAAAAAVSRLGLLLSLREAEQIRRHAEVGVQELTGVKLSSYSVKQHFVF